MLACGEDSVGQNTITQALESRPLRAIHLKPARSEGLRRIFLR